MTNIKPVHFRDTLCMYMQVFTLSCVWLQNGTPEGNKLYVGCTSESDPISSALYPLLTVFCGDVDVPKVPSCTHKQGP